MDKKIAVLIPCYNEAKTIEKVVTDFKNVLPNADIYVYDNNSSDDTAEIAKKAGAIVRYERRQGKGNVIRSMFHDIDADCYVMVDGDDTYDATVAPDIVNAVLKHGADMVIGDRLSSTYFTENKRPFHNVGNKSVRFLINRLFKNEIKDIMTGYRGFSKQFVKTFPVLSKGFEIETEMTIHALDKNFYIEEFPIQYRDRPDGSESKLNTVSDGIKVLKTIARLFREYKPFAFFTIMSIILWIISLCFFTPVFITFLETGIVAKIPTVIVSGITAVIGSLLFICGVILDVVVKKHRQLFELFLNQVKWFMKKYKELLIQILKFGFVGCTAFFIDAGILLLLSNLGINYLIANIISTTCSIIYNYILSIKFVFHVTSNENNKSFIQFVILSIIGLALTTLIMKICVGGFHLNLMFSKIFATGVVMTYNFISRKILWETNKNHWIFNGSLYL